MARGRELARSLTIACALAALWALSFPRPYALIVPILGVLPWVTIELARRHGGTFEWSSDPIGIRPNFLPSLLLPAISLYATRRGFHFDGSAAVVWVSGGIATLTFIWVIAIDPIARSKVGSVIGLLLVSALYGGGTASASNILLDVSPGTRFTPAVVTKRVFHRRKGDWYLVTLEPWGAERFGDVLYVSRDTYARIQPGWRAVITIHPGALGASWYTVDGWERVGRTSIGGPR